MTTQNSKENISENIRKRIFPHLSMLFYQKKVRNLSFDRATGDEYMWRSSSKTSFAVISVYKEKRDK